MPKLQLRFNWVIRSVSVPGVPLENGGFDARICWKCLDKFRRGKSEGKYAEKQKGSRPGVTGNGFDLGKSSQQEHFATFIIIQPIKAHYKISSGP